MGLKPNFSTVSITNTWPKGPGHHWHLGHLTEPRSLIVEELEAYSAILSAYRRAVVSASLRSQSASQISQFGSGVS